LGLPKGEGESLTPGPFAKHPLGAPKGRGEIPALGSLAHVRGLSAGDRRLSLLASFLEKDGELSPLTLIPRE